MEPLRITKAWRHWFAQRRWQPFPFQLETWSAYLNGESGLVHAPTGLGKTFAVWGGSVSEWLNEQSGVGGILIWKFYRSWAITTGTRGSRRMNGKSNV